MAIPNVSTLHKRIKVGSEGGLEFARLMNLLLIAKCDHNGVPLTTFSDQRGDFRSVDAIMDGNIGVQFKFYGATLSSQQKSAIKESLSKAISSFHNMTKWLLVTPEDFAVEDMKWFDQLRKEFEFRRKWDEDKVEDGYRRPSLKIFHWGHTEIIEMVLKFPHVGAKYFPELFQYDIQNFKLVNSVVDIHNTRWRSRGKYFFSSLNNFDAVGQPINLIFDFSFINDTPNTRLLHSIELVVEDLWNDIYGIRDEHELKSMGIIEIIVDPNAMSTRKELESPIIFKPNEPSRMQVEVKGFIEAYGKKSNTASVYFVFNFHDAAIHSPYITLAY